MDMELNIHNIRFYDYEPKAIHCIEYNKEHKLLALSRSDNRIEVWNCSCKLFKQKEFLGSKIGSIEALAWCNNSLFSAGQYDFIFEYDVDSFTIKRKTAVTGGVTWCLALSPNKELLAAGTEQGIVCLFTVHETEGLQFYKTLPRQEDRIFCISWHPSNEYLVTGSINLVHLKHIEKGQVLQFPVGKHNKNQNTIIWCISLLLDMTIVTGDSRGKTCFWNGQFGTLLSDIQTHQADVLTMSVTTNHEAVYVSGIDPVIVEVQLTSKGVKKRPLWVKSNHRRIHTHDVRAMALTEDEKLFTGGVDTYLVQSYYPPKTVFKYPAMPHRGYINISRNSHNILLGYEERLELWQVGTPDCSQNLSSRYLPIKEDRVKLAEIHLKKNERLHTCALSPEGRGIAYMTQEKMRINYFTHPRNFKQPTMTKITVPKSYSASILHWLDEERLLVSTTFGDIKILSVNGTEAVETKELSLPNNSYPILITSSHDGNYVVCVDSLNTTWVYNVEKADFKTLPRIKAPVTALAINKQNELFMTHSNLTLVEFDLHKHSYTQFGRRLMNSNNPLLLKSNYVIHHISFDNLSNSKIYLHTNTLFVVINKETVNEVNGSPKSSKIIKYDPLTDNENSNSSVRTITNGGFSFIERSNHVLHFEYLEKNNFASVELNPIWILDGLPPALKTKRFGVM